MNLMYYLKFYISTLVYSYQVRKTLHSYGCNAEKVESSKRPGYLQSQNHIKNILRKVRISKRHKMSPSSMAKSCK